MTASPLETVERLMPEEYHTGGLHDPDPLVRLWAVGHAMGYVAGMWLYADSTPPAPRAELVSALSALRSQAQREVDRGNARAG